MYWTIDSTIDSYLMKLFSEEFGSLSYFLKFFIPFIAIKSLFFHVKKIISVEYSFINAFIQISFAMIIIRIIEIHRISRTEMLVSEYI